MLARRIARTALATRGSVSAMNLLSSVPSKPFVKPSRCFSITPKLLEVITFNMADVGEGIKEVEILEWFVKEGDHVEEFQKLCMIQSDKATTEVTSRYTGKVVKIYTQVGDMQQIGDGLVDIDTGASKSKKPASEKKAAEGSTGGTASRGKKVVSFPMADVGEGIKEVEILGWSVKEGDEVAEFQKLCDVQSDKATAEITSKYQGKVVKIFTPAGEMQQVGQPLVDIEVDDMSDSGDSSAKPSEPEKKAESSSSPARASSGGFKQSAAGAKVLATPAVRRIAAENKVDLTQVPATGKDGRVTKGDILDFLAGKTSAKAAAPSQPPPQQQQQQQQQQQPAAPAPPRGPVYSPEDRTEQIKGRTKVMVQTMTESLKIPTFGAMDEVNMNLLVKLRKDLKPLVEKRGAKLSFMPFFIKAASLALKQYPVVNSTLNADVTQVTYKGAHNIGVAMDTAQGLVVPNVKDVQSKTIFQIAEDLYALQQRGASNHLTPADLAGGTFTLSNIGSIGGTYVSPVIFPPQTAIGGIGKMVKLPRYSQTGAIEEQHTLYISWTADHRVIDGATMVRFSNVFKEYLENPGCMLLDMA